MELDKEIELNNDTEKPQVSVDDVTHEFLRCVLRPDDVTEETNYDILGITKSATEKEIRNTYYKLIKKLHPDKNVCIDSKQVNKINHAYRILRNPIERAKYDQSLNYRRDADPDFVEMRNAAKNFLEKTNPNNGISEEQFENQKIQAKKLFDLEEKQLNIKNRYYTEQTKPIDASDLNHRTDNIRLTREQEDVENLPDHSELVENFDNKKFNEIFEEKIAKQQRELINYEDVNPFNFGMGCHISDIGLIDTGMQLSTDKHMSNIAQYDSLEDTNGQRIDALISTPHDHIIEKPLVMEDIIKQRALETAKLANITKKTASKYIAANGLNTKITANNVRLASFDV